MRQSENDRDGNKKERNTKPRSRGSNSSSQKTRKVWPESFVQDKAVYCETSIDDVLHLAPTRARMTLGKQFLNFSNERELKMMPGLRLPERLNEVGRPLFRRNKTHHYL